MDFIKRYASNTSEYDALRRASHILTGLSPNGWEYYVGETYFDYGQNWKWTTILCHCTGNGFADTYQALSPAAQEEIITAGHGAALVEACQRVLSGKFCPDRIKE